MEMEYLKKVHSMFMNYGPYFKEAWKGLLIMPNGIKFKIINMFGINCITKTNNNYFEIPCDPSYDGDILLLCNKSEISFDEVICIIENRHKRAALLGGISFIYWKYSKQFWLFLQECDEKKYKRIKKKCFSYFERLFEFLKKSDDTLYSQNEYIRNIYNMMKNR